MTCTSRITGAQLLSGLKGTSARQQLINERAVVIGRDEPASLRTAAISSKPVPRSSRPTA